MARSFEPIARPDARVLILGSVPGDISLAAQQYYANSRNAFWPIMESLFAGGAVLEYPARIELVVRSGLALWDVLASADRLGSLDSAIDVGSEVPNDIPRFLDSHGHVTHVFFNGSKAESAFNRHLGRQLGLGRLEVMRLPSTSPAHAGMSFDAKLEAWRVVAEAVGRNSATSPD
jgi:hypoxanthine-DNA glycosylase